MKYLFDPRFFNVVIILLFALAAVRWAFDGNLRQALYWVGGFIINFAITFVPDKP